MLGRYDFGREEDGDSPFLLQGDETDDLRGLGDIDDTLKIGVFAAYESGAWSARAELLQGIGGYDGLTGSVSAAYSRPLQVCGKRGFLSFEPRVDFGGDEFTSEYFGVTAAQSAGSGLAQYEADGGITSYGLTLVAGLALDRKWSLVGTLSYSRLTGDAANAPLVQERGSEDQFGAGVFLTRKF